MGPQTTVIYTDVMTMQITRKIAFNLVALGIIFSSGCVQQSTKQEMTALPSQQQSQQKPQSSPNQQYLPKQQHIEPLTQQSAKKPQYKTAPVALKPSHSLKKKTAKKYQQANQKDLWLRLRTGLELQEHYDNSGIEKQVSWYKNSQSYIDRVIQRGQPFLHHIIGELEANDMPLELAMLPAVESAYDTLAYSHSHASGLWQFIPGTGKRFGLQRDWWYDGRRDPVASTEAAIKYLKYLNKYFDGDWLLALAAYNSGEGTVRRAIKRNQAKGKPTDFWSLQLPRETRSYVPQLLAISRIVADPKKHGITLPDLIDKPYFTEVAVPEQIDLTKAAGMAGMETKELHRLNAGYNRWVTHPEGPQHIILPLQNVSRFQKSLASTPRNQWTPIKQYQVKSGDTLSAIAQRHQVPVTHLRSTNGLRNDFLRIGQKLKIPGTGFDSPFVGAMSIYTVKNGDSLWKIAKNQKISVRNIAKWNNLDVKSPLKLGQKLKVQSNKNTTASASLKKLRYKVRRGDSLYRIASKFDLKISDILTWNKLNAKKYLKPGQRLTLFVDVLNI